MSGLILAGPKARGELSVVEEDERRKKLAAAKGKTGQR